MNVDGLAKLEPRLSALLEQATALGRSGEFSEVEVWATLKPALARLIGWFRANDGDPALFTPFAYELAAREVLSRLNPAATEEELEPWETDSPWA
ncbi:MAG: hypothetical protein AB1641_03730 [Thermodesulfobacteriota bacterium]